MDEIEPESRAARLDAYPQLTAQRAPVDYADEFGLALQDRDRTPHSQEFLDQHTAGIRQDPHEFRGLARSDGSFIDTSKIDPFSQRANFVIVRDPSYVAGDGERMLVARDRDQGHADLAGGGPVKYAGEVMTNPWGQLRDSNANTGHYLQPDLARGAHGIDANPHLSDAEKAAAKAKLAVTAPIFTEMRNNKLQEVIDDRRMPTRPLTPPLRLETVNPQTAGRTNASPSGAMEQPAQPLVATEYQPHPPMLQQIGVEEPHEEAGASTSGALAKAFKGCCGLR